VYIVSKTNIYEIHMYELVKWRLMIRWTSSWSNGGRYFV